MTRPHWSYNQLSKYMRCSLAYYFEYIVGLPRGFVSSGQVLGSSVHGALAAYHQSIRDERVIGADAVRRNLHEAWKSREDRESIRYGPGESRDELLQQGEVLVASYLNQPPPENIVAIEETMLAPIRNSQGEVLERPLVTVLDLLTRHSTGLTITDFKTAGRSFSTSEAATSLQPTCYVNNVSQIHGEPVSFRYTVLVKTKTPRIQHLEAIRTETDIGRLGDLVEVVERAIDNNIFLPNESPMNCCACPYREQCRDWSSASGSRLVELRQLPNK